MKYRFPRFGVCSAIILMVCLAACSSRSPDQRGEETREAVAKATERMKPEIRWSARKFGQAAEWAAEETLAAIEGFFEGWNRSSTGAVDLNSSSERQLQSLPGITRDEATKIVAGRPYHSARELLTRGIVSNEVYSKIREQIAVRNAGR